MACMLTKLRLLALGLVAMVGLAGCGEWDPWAEPSSSASPAETATETATATPPPSVTVPPNPTPSPTATSTPLGPLTGTWDGTWVNVRVTPATGTFTLTWAQQGSRVVGAISVEGSNCLAAGSVDGTAVGKRLRFGAVEGAVTIEYDGTVVDEDKISGTYTSKCGDSEGTWTATRREP
jgi:hypothetical protein